MHSLLNKESTISKYLNNECVSLLKSLTPATGVICYEVDDSATPNGLSLYGIENRFRDEYADKFYLFDPLHPQKYIDSDIHVLSMKNLISSQELADLCFYTDHLRPSGFEEVIDLHFRIEGKIVAGMTLFFNEEYVSYYKAKSEKLEVLHHFIEGSIGKISQTDHSLKFDQFCNRFSLTKKERRILSLVIQGMANKDISNALYCSLATVKTHLQNIFNKLAVNSKAEAVTAFINTLH